MVSFRVNECRVECALAIVAIAIVGFGNPAWAGIVESVESSPTDNFNSLISATDLINEGQVSLSSKSIISGGFWAGGDGLNGLNDGIGQDGVTPNNVGGVLESPVTFEYILNTDASSGGSALGYDIVQVDAISGWATGEDFANQSWSISVATVDDPTTFTDLRSIFYAPFAKPVSGQEAFGYAHVKLTDDTGAIATGVSAVRITSVAATTCFTIYSEFDIAGAPTVPEPSSIALLATGLIGLCAYASRRKR